MLICVVGATGIGKTALAIEIAKAFATEIISADSRQFFKEMTIGTAVPSSEELAAAPHHFIQHKSIFDSYSVGDFEREALLKLDVLFEKHQIVVLVGGSGLYVDAVVSGLDSFPEIPSEIRAQLNSEFSAKGIAFLRQELSRVDPEYFKKVDAQNSHRLIRALEIYRGTGKPYSSFLKKKKTSRNFDTLYVGLTADRKIIYDRINRRVDNMVASGLIEEAKNLLANKKSNALQTVGYRELFQFFEGEFSQEKAIEEIKKNTRRFAKRQHTWFGKNDTINWFNFETPIKDIIACIKAKKAL
ncbi:tRNA dimethylallyltransferase [Ulvibacter sp. MAR_2010_11]|nr:tRNA dimethylallyltransferase [Ulvibacter sp. MAR_2010_11]